MYSPGRGQGRWHGPGGGARPKALSILQRPLEPVAGPVVRGCMEQGCRRAGHRRLNRRMFGVRTAVIGTSCLRVRCHLGAGMAQCSCSERLYIITVQVRGCLQVCIEHVLTLGRGRLHVSVVAAAFERRASVDDSVLVFPCAQVPRCQPFCKSATILNISVLFIFHIVARVIIVKHGRFAGGGHDWPDEIVSQAGDAVLMITICKGVDA